MAAASYKSRHRSTLSPYLEIVLVLILLLIAGYLRMARPGLTEFKADEARLLDLALDMAEGEFALRGISSSVGFPNFPASVWIYSLPLVFWPHPYAATLFTGLLNTTAVGFTYWFARRYWGTTVALASTLMFAVSPWAVVFSRKIWAQNLLPLFVIGWAITAALALVERRSKYLVLHFLFLALAVQIHLAAVALVPATIILLLVFRQRVQWRTLLAGLLVATLTVIPFTIYLSQNPEVLTLPLSSGNEAGSGLTADSVFFTAMISLGTSIHSLAGADIFRELLALLPPRWPVYVVWAVLIVSGSLYLLRQAWKRWSERSAQVGLIALIWLVLPALFFLWHSTPVSLHYFIAVLPAPYIAAGVAVGQSLSLPKKIGPRSNRWIVPACQIGIWTLLLFTAFLQIWTSVSLTDFVGSVATPGAFGVPLAINLETVDIAQQLMVETGAREILVAGDGESPRLDAFPAEWDVLLRGVPHRFVDVRRSALFPTEAVVVILDARERTQPWTGDIYRTAASAEQEFTLRPGEGSYYILALDGAARPEPTVPLEQPLLLANWVNLLGTDPLQRYDEEMGIWQVHWRTGDNPDPADYHFFNHLLDAQDTRIAQADEPAFSPQQWRAGDTVISRFLIPWRPTAEPEAMRVGMYRFPSLENVPVLDEAGNPAMDAVTFSIDNQTADLR